MARQKDTGLKDKIIEAAYLHLLEDDANFTTAEIARAANVAEGTLYNYFRNKRDLIRNLIDYTFNNYYKKLDTHISHSENINDVIHSLFNFHTEYFSESSKLFKLMLNPQLSELGTYTFFPRIFLNYKNWIKDTLDKHSHQLKKDINTDYVATYILGILNVLVIRSSSFQDGLNLIDAVKKAEEMIINFILKERKG